eukprot:5639092-Pleurochrysis_carterae.AAC.4
MVEVDSGVRRADAPHAFECLPLQRRAPLGVEQQHDVGGLQVETHTTGACRCEEQRRQLGGGEGAHDVHALFLAHLAVDPPVAAHAAHAVRAKRRTEFELRRIERRVVRGEDDDLVDAPPIPDAAPRGLECHAVFFLRSKAARSNDSIEITPLCPGKYSCSGLCCLLQLESRKRRCCTWSGRVRLFISLCSRRLRGLNDCLRGLANTDARLMNARRPAICKSDCDLFLSSQPRGHLLKAASLGSALDGSLSGRVEVKPALSGSVAPRVKEALYAGEGAQLVKKGLQALKPTKATK